MSIQVEAQNWLDTNIYPFDHHYFDLPGGRMHYVDEGRGPVLLMAHGTPTWSFLYRDLIQKLSRQYRCIAIDHLGFGLSDKPVDFAGSPQDHSRHLEQFMTALDLRNVTLLVHDFGGPIGLGAALNQPERIEKIVLLNTWLWATDCNVQVQKIDKFLHSALGRWLYLRFNISPRVLLKKGYADRQKLSRSIHRHYINAFPSRDSRWALYRIALSLRGASDWYQQQWERLHRLEDIEWEIIWGSQDTFISMADLERWKMRWPQARVHVLECGHFIPEEAPKELSDILLGRD